MSITDELRKWGYGFCGDTHDVVTAIADRIDAEHERQLEVLYRDMSDAEYVKLPKDADGEYIRIGDELRDDWNEQNQGEVEWLMLDRYGWWFMLNNSGEQFYANEFHEWRHRHHQAPTVDDLLFSYGQACIRASNEAETEAAKQTMLANLRHEYAAKLSIAGNGKE